MTGDERIRLEGVHLNVGRKRIALRSAAMHYWRHAPETWATSLAAVRDLGLSMVETYIPWGVHENADGTFDFGATDPRKDLGRFLEEAEAAGLYVFVRPGPHINAELTYFGLPERVVRDPEVQARTPRGNAVTLYFPPRMFPVPSHASERYFDQVDAWFEALAPVLAPHVWPEGPVVLLQIDNELGYFFRNGPFCQDYHPDAVAQWHGYLEERHGSREAAGAAHGRRYGTWADAEPPTHFDLDALDPATTTESAIHRALCRQLDWARFQERLLAQALGRFGRGLARVGLDRLPTVHNLSLGDGGLPVSPPELEAHVDLVGFDYYHPAASDTRALSAIRRRTLYLAGTFGAGYAPELGVGAPPWFTPLTPEDSITAALAAMAYGLRGFNLYMGVDRDRWYGAPIDAQGRTRPVADEWRRVLEACASLGLAEATREAKVALLWPREYARLSRATHLLGLASPATMEAIGAEPTAACRPDSFGFADVIQWDWFDVLMRVAAALRAANVPYVFVDSEAPLARYASYDVLFAPCYEFANVPRLARLEAAAAAGTHVVMGPRKPMLDDRLMPLDSVALPAVVAVDPGTVQELVHEWIDRFDLARPYPALGVDTAVHRDAEGRDVALFLINEGPARQAEVRVPAGRAWSVARDVRTDETFEGDVLHVPMRAHQVRLFALEGPSAEPGTEGAS